MAGFLPVASFPVASVPEAAAIDYNNVTPSASILLDFTGFLPTIVNNPGFQVEQFNFYAVGSDSAPDLQVEQLSTYIVAEADSPDLQAEQFGAYIIAAVGAPFQVEQFGLYVVGAIISTLQVEQFGLYVAESDGAPDLQVEMFGFYLVARSTPLVIPALAGITPEIPVQETWQWLSDIMTSEDGTEQRVNVRAEPRRILSNKYVFADNAKVRLAKQQLYQAFRDEVAVPIYPYASRLKAPATIGATYLTFNPVRTDLRDDGWVLIIENDTYELKTVDTVDGTGCSITTPLVNAYTTKANVIAVAISVIDDSAALIEYNANDVATLTLKSQETSPIVPFIRPGTTATLTMFNGLPVLERRAIGSDFNDVFIVGREITDYGGKVFHREPWNFSKISGDREYLCNRVLDLNDWDYWKVFFDYCKGTVNPFYVPTYREDFEFITPPDEFTFDWLVAGHDYSSYYFLNPVFKQIAAFAQDGTVQYINVVTSVPSGDNDIITVETLLGSDTDWTDAHFCILLRAHLNSDEVNLEHSGLQTLIKTSIRSTDV